MGYAPDSDEHYLSIGERTASALRVALQKHDLGHVLQAPVFEWGVASGRVLRHFADGRATNDIWGADLDGSHLQWAKENLSPPLRLVTCTAYPHLPFEDGMFGLAYGISVFTHIYHLLDTWLMEIRRILVPGGCALFTIHDEHSWQWLREHWKNSPFWQRWLREEELANDLRDDLYVLRHGHGGAWNELQVFFRTDWIRQEWSHYFDIISIEPRFEAYQSLVILRKPAATR